MYCQILNTAVILTRVDECNIDQNVTMADAHKILDYVCFLPPFVAL